MRPMIRRRALACAVVLGFLSLVRADPMALGAWPPNPSGAMRALVDLEAQDTGAFPGDLDTTFSGDGMEITNLGGSDYGKALAIQRDGKIVAVGGSYVGAGGAHDFALARYNPDGSLDETFSGDGMQTTDFGDVDYAWAVAIQADDEGDKIVVVGPAGDDFALARYNADGSLDETFADGGKMITDFGGEGDAAYGVALQPDGKIVVVGRAGADFALARYNTDGSLDTSFPGDKLPGDGKQTTDFGGGFDYGLAVTIQADGKIVVAGVTNTPPTCDWCGDSSSNFALARYTADGTLDTSFSGDGKLTTDFGGDDGASGVALQADGKIVAVGGSYVFHASAQTFALARYNPDGSLDDTFGWLGSYGWPGVVITQFVGSDGASGVAIQPDGKIVAAGSAGGEFALARYKPDGSLDATFSHDGTQMTDFGLSDGASGVALQPDGQIVTVGAAYGDGAGDFALARYHGGLGSSDTTPPQTTITGGPPGTTNDNTPIFSFDASEGGSTFECRFDGSGYYGYDPCSSPHTSTLSDGLHTFEVRAIDPARNTDQTPAGLVFSVDTAPPETTVTGGPTGTTNDSAPTFSFDSSEEGSTFACRIDANPFAPCNSPHTYSPLGAGSHSFQVGATDGAGNTDPTPASRSLMIVTTYRTEVLATSGLVSYWRLGETSGPTAADARGTHNGSYRNGVLLDRPGALLNDSNASASFDGSNDYVSVADSALLDTGDSFTLEAWIKRSGVSSSTGTVLSKGNGSFRLSFVNSVLTLMKSNSGTIARAKVSTTDTIGFHHVVATKSGATVKLYIDGADRTGTVTNRTIANTSAALNIGRDTAGSEYFAGLIDEVAIYNVALSAAQVQQHFKASWR